jgi:hypothetical protein
MTLADIDLWIGRTLFLPPIIKLCQVTKQTQFAVSRLFWFVAALDQLRIAETLIGRIIAGAFCIVMMITASLRADMPTFSMMWFRMMAVAFLVLDVAHGIGNGAWKGVEIWLFVLFAEYAATIRTIPPASTRETAARKADVTGR